LEKLENLDVRGVRKLGNMENEGKGKVMERERHRKGKGKT
jgi:hypothetical protein